MIEKPPKISNAMVQRAIKLLSDSKIKETIDSYNDDYLYWSDIKYKPFPDDTIDKETVWACIKVSRMMQRTFIWNKYGIHFYVTNKMQRQCHDFDMNYGGSWIADGNITDDNRKRFLISSLMEEAISSSQMEGAATTRKVAKEMLRKEIKPRNKSEMMIYNNYKCIRFITDNKNNRLTPEMLLEMHVLITKNTLEDPENEGRFRQDDTVDVIDSITHETVHTPPTHTDIPGFVSDLCAFFNGEDNHREFIHPIIKGIMIHFLLAYVHPFADGNGRTARALFYFYMLKAGYWITEYLSISRIIYKTKKSYEKSFLRTEADENDAGYFIAFNLRILELAFSEFRSYVQRKNNHDKTTLRMVVNNGLNERQAKIISMVKENPQRILTVKELQNIFGVSHVTVTKDMDALLKAGIMSVTNINKVKKAYFKGNAFDRIISEE